MAVPSPRKADVVKLNEWVISRIKDHITEHRLVPGDRLPTEQQMAEMFGVSRVSIREATRALAFLGIIDAAPRRGLTLGGVDMQRVSQYLGFHFALSNYSREQLLKSRIIIETGALAEAMEQVASDPTCYDWLAALADRIGTSTDADAFIASDLAFHQTLIACCKLEPLIAFSSLLDAFFRRFREEVLSVRDQWHLAVIGHRIILDTLRIRDLARAQELMRLHLDHYHGHL